MLTPPPRTHSPTHKTRATLFRMTPKVNDIHCLTEKQTQYRLQREPPDTQPPTTGTKPLPKKKTERPKSEATQQVSFRLSLFLIQRIDAYTTAFNEAHLGAEITRADTVRILLEHGLAEITFPTVVQKKRPT